MFAKILLMASALFLGAIGVVLNFMPQEIAADAGFSGLPMGTLLFQLLAGFLIAMAVLNWMCRDHRVGGIYGRPLALANGLQFVVGAFALGRAAVGPLATPAVWALFGFYLLFTLGFLWLVFVAKPAVAAKAAEAQG